MGSISTNIDVHEKLTTAIAKGTILFEDMLNWIIEYYSGMVTEFIIWDFSEADFSKFTTNEIKRIAVEVSNRSIDRTGGKTALVFQRDLDFGLGRMF